MAKKKIAELLVAVMLHNVLTSIEILTDAARSFWNRCATGRTQQEVHQKAS